MDKKLAEWKNNCVSSDEAAEFLGIKPTRLSAARRKMRLGDKKEFFNIPFYKLGSNEKVFYKKDDLIAFVEKNKVKP